MKLYKIYTEDINRKQLLEKVAYYFPDGATVTFGQGIFEKSREFCAIIEVCGEGRFWVTRFVEAVKKMNNQKCLLVVTSEVEANFI